MIRRALTLLSLCILSTGCFKVGPDFCCPCPPEKYDWIPEDSKISGCRDNISTWWKVFDDPVLNNLIDVAHAQNLDLQIAGYRIMEARANLGIAVGEFFPQLQEGIGSATHTKISKNAPNTGRMPDNPFKDYLLGFQAQWEIDFWGKFRRAIESADASFCASIYNYDDAMVILLSDVAATYVRIRTTQELINIVKSNVKVQHRGWEISDAQYRGGFVTELDVQQALTLLRGTEARLPVFEAELRAAENALCVLLGIPPQDVSNLLLGPEVIPVPPTEVAVGIPAELLNYRPDIRRSLLETKAQSARIGVAYADLFPQFSVAGFIGLESSGNSTLSISGKSGNLLSRNSLTYNYGMNFAWPILNYGRIINAVHVEDARLKQLILDYENNILNAYREVEDGLIAFLKSQDQVTFLKDSTKAAARSVDLSKTQYVEGAADYTRVLTTQESLLAEQEKLANARADIAFSLISTYKALGGGWEIRCN